MPARIFITRDEQDLGAFPADEVPSLLATGFLRPADQFRIEGEEHWRRLEEFASLKESLTRTTPLQTAAARANETIREFARRVARGSASLVSSTERATTAATNRLLEDYLPRLAALVRGRMESAQRSTASLLRDEEKLRKLFGAAYDTLPKPIHRFVTESQFLEFCFRHRERLLGRDKPKAP